MFFKFKNHLAFVKLIDFYKNSSLISYDHCLFLNVLCIVIINHSKCIKCICCDCFCVNIFFKSLNCTYKKLKSELKLIVKECVKHSITIVRFNAKLTKLLSQIKHNKLSFIFKTHCVTTELDDDNDEMKNENNSFNILQLINSMLSFF